MLLRPARSIPLAAALALIAIAPARAAPDNWAGCAGEDAQAAIDACTALIESAPPGDQALAYLDRSLAWRTLAHKLRALAGPALGSPGAAAIEAGSDIDQALRLSPDFAEALTNRAVLRYELGAWPLAVADASRAIELKPSLAEAWNIRALANLKRGDTVAASRDFDQTIRLEKNYGNALIARVLGPFVPDGAGSFKRLKPPTPFEP